MLLLLLHLVASDSSAYWQQGVTYEIAARLDETSGVLTGRARIVYVNQSPDTLRDFFVHQYLNAFRPGSRWAAADSSEGRVRFQHLQDPDYAFERITAARVQGNAAAPDYPYAPDSTVAHWGLARPLAPGDSLVAVIDWQARLSTVVRRQGRQGRRFDFAQWYPKVVVYDKYGWEDHPLYPAGEFYGEFATFDVVLDLPEDQVIGATGVAVEGDPGWERAKADSALVVDYQRDWYRRSAGRCGVVDPGRKCVRFRAEQVHHFAFSLNPRYRYEQGRSGNAVVRVLYLPEDAATWGQGIAVARTEAALDWLARLYGEYQWPQLTNVHRIEGGGTEFPMMLMNGGASLSLIVHEAGHQYTMGQLANNEWREGWLDEGFTSFQAGLFTEAHGGPPAYANLEPEVLWLDLHGWSEPISMVSERFNDFTTYGEMIYAKAQLFFEELRYVVGDVAMRRILRTYFARWKLKHVDEDAFRSVAEEVSGQDLQWLFGQWLHNTVLIDYRLRRVTRRHLADGRWQTTVTLERLGSGWMPIEVGDRDGIYARATGQPAVERVEFTTDHRPGRLVLDPRGRTHDWNMLNNHEPHWLTGRAVWEVRRDNPTRQEVRRDRLVRAWMPVLWSSDFGGLTVGLRERTNYFGSYDQGLTVLSVATRGGATDRVGVYARVTNPLGDPSPRVRRTAALWNVDGRAGVAIDIDGSLRRHLSFGPDPHVGFDAIWMATSNTRYVDPRLWDNGGTVELGNRVETTVTRAAAIFRARAAAHGGLAYWNPATGLSFPNRYDVAPFGRFAAEASARVPAGRGRTVGLRAFAGAYVSGSDPLKQRRIMLAGADPYETFTNPLLRSLGGLLARPNFYYHAPGGAGLRAYAPWLGGRWAGALNAEIHQSVMQRGEGPVRSIAVAAFWDGGLVDTAATGRTFGSHAYSALQDAGVGVVSRHQVGDLAWTLRLEFPFVVSAPDLAPGYRPAGGRVAFRWLVSLAPSF
jgi:hypothetical protein